MKLKKNILSLLLALAVCLGLTLPAFAADAPHDVDAMSLPATWQYWGDKLLDGAALTINGVIGQQEYEGTILFDVVVGGGYTLDMPFTAGRHHFYSIYPGAVLLNGEYVDDAGSYRAYLPEESYGYGDDQSPQPHFQFVCPKNMVSSPGAELLYEIWLDWDEGDLDSDYSTYNGNVNFWLRVNPAPVNIAYASTQTYEISASETRINGAAAALEAIILKDDAGNGYTYYKLRDLGEALGFNVGWSAEAGVFVETGKPYIG